MFVVTPNTVDIREGFVRLLAEVTHFHSQRPTGGCMAESVSEEGS